MKTLKADLVKMEEILQLDELRARERVLRRLGYITSAGVVDMKGAQFLVYV